MSSKKENAMPTTRFETERLTIVPFAEEHLTARYVGWLSDPEVVKHSEQRYRKHTLDSCRSYWESFEGSDNHFWAIVAKDTALGHIGNINAYVETRHAVADIGILLGERAVWGHGYGTEAWRAVMRFLFRTREMRKLTAGTLSTNAGMLAIMTRSGMLPDGKRERQYVYDGKEVDVVYGAAFRDTWSDK
jgi:RimJ/RimL family protein N-acetyltransferase